MSLNEMKSLTLGSSTYNSFVDETARGKIDKMAAYVTPEMYGAKGDGVTDDTAAMQACINANRPIFATKTYKISSTIRCESGLYLFGGGTFIGKSADEVWNMFYVSKLQQEIIRSAVVRDISFISTRDNTNIYPPAGYTRAEGSLSSNVNFLYFTDTENVTVENVRFEGGEYDINLYDCENVSVTNFISNNASMFVYCQGNGSILFGNGKVKLYDLVSAGDHHFYICHSNDSVFIEDVKMYSVETSGIYPVHVYASDEQIANYGATRIAKVKDCYMEASNSATVCMIVGEKFKLDNCIFKGVNASDDARFFYGANENATVEIRNTIFENFNSFSMQVVPPSMQASYVKFINCKFGCQLYVSGTVAKLAEFFNCDLIDIGDYATSDSTMLFRNCKLNSHKYVAEVYGTQKLKFVNCEMYANAAGIISARNDNADLTLIGCYGDNADSAKKFEYNSSYSPIIKVYNCTFPTLALRNPTGFIEKNNVWSTT